MARQVVALERERAHLRRAIEQRVEASVAHAAPAPTSFAEVLSENGEADAFIKASYGCRRCVWKRTGVRAPRASHVAPTNAISEKLEHQQRPRETSHTRESRAAVASAPPIEFPS